MTCPAHSAIHLAIIPVVSGAVAVIAALPIALDFIQLDLLAYMASGPGSRPGAFVMTMCSSHRRLWLAFSETLFVSHQLAFESMLVPAWAKCNKSLASS